LQGSDNVTFRGLSEKGGVNLDIEQALQSVKDVYVNYPKRIQQNEEALKKVEKEIQDLLHVIELKPFDAYNGYKYAKQLQVARKERRRIKDEIELLSPVREFLKFTKPTEKNITKIINEVQGIKSRHQDRIYKMRIREDLQELVR
jgi:vacuolar-type H+-ATPase subunit I/STV1